MEEMKKYEVIKKLVESNGNKDRAALELGVTKRHINRLVNRYRQEGKAAFSHGNKNRTPATAIPKETRQLVLDLYRTKYADANFTHFTELLARIEHISLSVSTVASILEAEFLLSPKATRAKRKRLKQALSAKQASAKTKKEAERLQTNLVCLEDAHSRRPRAAYTGELLQMDASPFLWFGDSFSTLHIAVDDASGTITGAWLDTQETLNGYYHVLHQTLTGYGIPYRFFTDRRTVFLYKKKNSPTLEEDTYTQFAYACKQLGIQLEASSVPQAKGRVERMFQTLQSRLPVEFRLAGITELSAANEFLHSYIEQFNHRFALPFHSIKSVFELQPETEKINLILAVLTERKVDSGHCIQFQNQYYRMLDRKGAQVHYRKGTPVTVIQAYDGQLFCCVNDREVYALEAILSHETGSPEFDIGYQKPKQRERLIPPMNPPWRRKTFQSFVRKQPHQDSYFPS